MKLNVDKKKAKCKNQQITNLTKQKQVYATFLHRKKQQKLKCKQAVTTIAAATTISMQQLN